MIGVRRDGATTWLTLDRAEKLNAFTVDGYRELRVQLQELMADSSTRVAVLTGTGRAFSVGADRSLLDGSMDASQRRGAGDEFDALLEVLAGFEKPLVAAVNGLAVGFGCTALLYCDVILVAESARLRMPFTAMGIVPEAGSSVLLPARVRWADAMWSMLSSEWIDAGAAVRMGLALDAVPDADLVTRTTDAAQVLAAHDPRSVAATKRLLVAGRSDAARRAAAREVAEMGHLLGPRDD